MASVRESRTFDEGVTITMDEPTTGRSLHTSMPVRRALAAALAIATSCALLQAPFAAAAEDAPTRLTTPTEASGPATSPSGPLVATDALGRDLSDYTDVPAPRDDRTVGVFYALWHGSNDMREYKNIFDNNAALAEDPLAWQTPDSGAFPPPGHFAYWGEPLYGYYRSDDAWVMRRHLQMLADAQVDYLVLDASNWEIYKPQATLLMQTIVELQAQGVRAPQVVFMTHTESTQSMDEIYRTFYADDAPHRYPSTWFQWDGKPLIMGESPSETVQDFFTLRTAQWPNEPQQPSEGWDWISFDRPQRGNYDADGNLEQMAVSPAQNSGSSSIFSNTSWYGVDDPPSLSRSYHDGAEDESAGAETHGYNFQEQWDHAIVEDPETILILEWNEWIAGNWAASPTGPMVFYDVVNTRWSRDLEPMTGGYGDNYYLQMVDNIRRYKGVNPPGVASPETTIDVRKNFRQWRSVTPEYTDYEGDTAERNHPGVGAQAYVNTTGRNDIVASKVARDDESLYFYARAADRLTDDGPNWMTLYLNVDSDGTNGWSGYDYRVTWPEDGARSPVLERPSDDGWEVVNVSIPSSVLKDELMLAVPRSAFGLAADPLSLEFKWWDNQQADDIMDSYTSGDAAPDGRFNYLYDTGEHPVPQALPGPPEVDPLPVQMPGAYRIEDDDPSTDYETFVSPERSDWLTVADEASSGGTYSYLYNPGGAADSFYRNFIRAGFEGNSVRWIAPTGPQGTEAEVFIDGLSQGVVNLYTSEWREKQGVFEVHGLPEGWHEIMVVFEPQSGTYYHDSFEYGVGRAGLPGRGSSDLASSTAYTTASSFDPAQWFGTNGAQVTDGDPSSYWRGTEEGDHVELAFGRSINVDDVTIVPRTDESTITAFEVQAHTRGGWQVVAEGTELTEASTIDVPRTRADRLRVVALTTTGGAPELYEVSVNGVNGAPDATGTSWEFTSDVEGWTGSGPVEGPTWIDGGAIRGQAAGDASALLSPDDLEIDADDFSSLLLKLGNGTEAREGYVVFTAATADGETVTGRRSVRITSSSGPTDYVVDMTDAQNWTGTITQIGFEVSAPSGHITLGYVRLAPDHAVYASHFDTAEHGWSGTDLSWDDGMLVVPLDGEDDAITSPDGLRTDVTNADSVVLRIANPSSATAARIWFATESADGFATERSVTVQIAPGVDTYTSYGAATGDVTGWTGTLDQLRVEFIGATPGEEVRIDAVRVEPFVISELSTQREWTFDADSEGWGQTGDIDGFAWQDGAVGGTIVGPDPQIYSPSSLWIDLTGLWTVSVRLAVQTGSSEGTLYFTTESSPGFSQANSVRIPLVAGETGYVDYLLDMSDVAGWTGLLRQIRLDPEEGDSSGTFLVDHLALLDYRVPAVEVATTPGTAPTLPDTLEVAHSDGTTTAEPVTWAEIDPESYTTAGTLHVAGTLTDLGVGLTAVVRVGVAPSAWEFTNDTEGWQSGFGVSDFAWSPPGVVTGSLWYGDARILSAPGLGVPLDDVDTIRIGLRNATAGTSGTLFFITTADGSYDAAKSVTISVQANDPGITEYVLDVSEVPGWTGTLDQFRLDPVDGVSTGTFELDYVRLE